MLPPPSSCLVDLPPAVVARVGDHGQERLDVRGACDHAADRHEAADVEGPHLMFVLVGG